MVIVKRYLNSFSLVKVSHKSKYLRLYSFSCSRFMYVVVQLLLSLVQLLIRPCLKGLFLEGLIFGGLMYGGEFAFQNRLS